MKSFILKYITPALVVVLHACSKPEDVVKPPVVIAPVAVEVKLEPAVTYQNIAGFGGANRMWGTQTLESPEAQKAFGINDNELGLSIFRVRLSSNRNDWQQIVNSVKEANKHGVIVIASPWSPPAKLKSNNSDIGGHLLPENYKAFKDYINEFIDFMKERNAIIDVVSIQNEPDIKVSYESCDWTSDEMINFLNAPGTINGARLAGPESFNFNQNFTNSLLLNTNARAQLSIVAGHIYGGGLSKFPLAEEYKKEIWMTEYLLNLNVGNAGAAKWNTYPESTKWEESLKMLGSIHDAMINNWNAYIWWYLQRFYSFIGDGEEGTTNGTVLKRGIAFSHFSKFVRPGSKRIGVSLPSTSTLKVTGYTKDNKTFVVILNPESQSIAKLKLSGTNMSSATSFTTTESQSMKTNTPSVNTNSIELVIPAMSITTVVISN